MEIKILSSLAKVFCNEICGEYEIDTLSCLKKERTSFLIAVKPEKDTQAEFLTDCNNLKIFRIVFVPAEYIAGEDRDDYYIRNGMKGYYPDVLVPLDGAVSLKENEWTAVWCEYTAEDDKEVSVTVKTADKTGKVTLKTEIADTSLDEQSLICTHWFHADCLADYYNVEVFSEEH